ncbi:hypothetical protein SAMN05444169_6813 [Bradyrhizobium erythrophlei]|uniref:Uncharacterized protein n=1 Tax=Bradyrhizobium erythrophlei TaxID=1437360 RepID=A0A1M5RWN1_9BRAD|nr:hypothetical protein SAMN05444169_6813 [Bradyrhizobium erythrophlei]
MTPPICSTMRRLMAPSPVPPKRRLMRAFGSFGSTSTLTVSPSPCPFGTFAPFSKRLSRPRRPWYVMEAKMSV